MAKRAEAIADLVLETDQSTVLDTVDELINRGVVANGDVTIGLAGVDLIYLRLSALLCAAERILPPKRVPRRRSDSRRRRRAVKAVK